MDSKRAAQLISENLTSVYGYAYARLYDKEQVEDLTSEILCEVLASVQNLKNERAFWGFVWKIAENTFRKFIRREQLRSRVEPLPTEVGMGICGVSPEDTFICQEEQSEELYLLRRELSLLTKTYREICVAYYIHQQSCSQIAKDQNISVEMVKYYLFKTRKLLKEGMNMTRSLGEKSYNPGTFRLRFLGDENFYGHLCDRKLPGSIMLAAYDAPVSVQELSVELGVAMPYLEEEVDILEAAGLLRKAGTKYQTNVIIFTDDYEKEFECRTADIYKETATRVFDDVTALLPRIRSLDFAGNTYDDNRLLFAVLNIAMAEGLTMSNKTSPIGDAPKLPLGGDGWLFGYDNDECAHSHFGGVTKETWNRAKFAWFTVMNYRVIESCQFYDQAYFPPRAKAMCDAVLGNAADEENSTLPWLIENGFIFCNDGRLSANFPVFRQAVYEALCDILSPVLSQISDCMILVSDQAEKILTKRVPAAVRRQCGAVAKIHHRLDTAAFLMENLIDMRKLHHPSEKMPLCVYGVTASEIDAKNS